MNTQLNDNPKYIDALLELQSGETRRHLRRQAENPKMTIRDSVAALAAILTAAVGLLDHSRSVLWSMVFAAQLAVWFNVRASRQMAAVCDLLDQLDSRLTQSSSADELQKSSRATTVDD